MESRIQQFSEDICELVEEVRKKDGVISELHRELLDVMSRNAVLEKIVDDIGKLAISREPVALCSTEVQVNALMTLDAFYVSRTKELGIDKIFNQIFAKSKRLNLPTFLTGTAILEMITRKTVNGPLAVYVFTFMPEDVVAILTDAGYSNPYHKTTYDKPETKVTFQIMPCKLSKHQKTDTSLSECIAKCFSVKGQQYYFDGRTFCVMDCREFTCNVKHSEHFDFIQPFCTKPVLAFNKKENWYLSSVISPLCCEVKTPHMSILDVLKAGVRRHCVDYALVEDILKVKSSFIAGKIVAEAIKGSYDINISDPILIVTRDVKEIVHIFHFYGFYLNTSGNIYRRAGKTACFKVLELDNKTGTKRPFEEQVTDIVTKMFINQKHHAHYNGERFYVNNLRVLHLDKDKVYKGPETPILPMTFYNSDTPIWKVFNFQ